MPIDPMMKAQPVSPTPHFAPNSTDAFVRSSRERLAIALKALEERRKERALETNDYTSQTLQGYTSPLEEVETDVETLPKGILMDGKDVKSFEEGLVYTETALGNKVWAFTDIGFNYGKAASEDRIGIVSDEDLVVAVDGMGGVAQGDVAAHVLTEEFLNNPRDSKEAVKSASERLLKDNILGGACFASVRIKADENENKWLHMEQAGDVKVIVLRNNEVVFESQDESLVADLVKAGLIEEDSYQYNCKRNIVNKAVSADSPSITVHTEPFLLKPSDLIVVGSDGLFDNLKPDEIATLNRGKIPKELMECLYKATDYRMGKPQDSNTQGIQSADDKPDYQKINYKSQSKPDNRAFAAIEVS